MQIYFWDTWYIRVVEWTVVDQDTVQRAALVKVINLLVPQKAGNFFTDRVLPSYERLYSVEMVERRTCLCSRYLWIIRLLCCRQSTWFVQQKWEVSDVKQLSISV